jgi:hypothetical protein
MSHDDIIIAAENAHILYTRHLRDVPTATVPRHWVEELLSHVDALLEAHAELAVADDYEEPPMGGYDDEPDNIEEIDEWGADSPPDDTLETDYEGPTH